MFYDQLVAGETVLDLLAEGNDRWDKTYALELLAPPQTGGAKPDPIGRSPKAFRVWYEPWKALGPLR